MLFKQLSSGVPRIKKKLWKMFVNTFISKKIKLLIFLTFHLNIKKVFSVCERENEVTDITNFIYKKYLLFFAYDFIFYDLEWKEMCSKIKIKGKVNKLYFSRNFFFLSNELFSYIAVILVRNEVVFHIFFLLLGASYYFHKHINLISLKKSRNHFFFKSAELKVFADSRSW